MTHGLTSCVAGVVRVDRVHVLDAAEQDNILRLVSHHIPLPADHHMTHCEGAVHVEDLSGDRPKPSEMRGEICMMWF